MSEINYCGEIGATESEKRVEEAAHHTTPVAGMENPAEGFGMSIQDRDSIWKYAA